MIRQMLSWAPISISSETRMAKAKLARYFGEQRGLGQKGRPMDDVAMMKMAPRSTLRWEGVARSACVGCIGYLLFLALGQEMQPCSECPARLLLFGDAQNRVGSDHPQLFVAQVGDEHVPWRVGDDQRRPGLHRHRLGRHATGPEHRDLASRSSDGSPKSGLARSAMPSSRGSPTCTGRHARRKSRCDLHGAHHLVRRHRPHAHYHRPAQAAGGLAGDGAVHRDVVAVLDVPDWHAVGQQRSLETEAAADEEGHHVVLPEGRDVLHLLIELAIAVDAVAREVRADIGAWRRVPWLEARRVGDVQQRAGFGVALAEQQEVVGQLTPRS